MRYVSGHSVSGHIYPVCKTLNTHQMQSLRYGIMVTASSVAMMLASCTNDDFPGNENLVIASDRICFGISPDKVEVGRGSICYDASVCVDTLVLRSDFSTDTLCAEVIVTDNISSSSFYAGLSRGVPVTKEDFYDKFHVLAYWRKSGALEPRFYINDDVTDKGGNLWSTGNVYYWMDAQQSLQFYAWAPTDAGGLTTPMTPQSTTLNYTVPLAAMEQKDIVVAKTEELPGNNNAVVPLSFNHVCAGVRFVVGDRMQAGSIKSVALYGVKNTGIYDMSVSTWTLGESTADFSQQLNITTTGNESDGTQITTAEGTFMMLPQTLGADAQLTVVFHDDVTGEDRTLTSSLAGRTWPQGKVTTYRIGISANYQLEFKSEPAVQDAHYVIYPITIHADNLPRGWTLTSDDEANVTFVESGKFVSSDVQALVDAGYWLDGYNGNSTLTSTTQGDVKVYVFLTENATEIDRNITLMLRPANSTQVKPVIFNFTQYCPAWNNGIGVERIEDGDYPWGFSWDSSMKVTYSMPSGFWAGIWHFLFEIFGDHSYIESTGSAWGGSWKVAVDFSKVPKLTKAINPTNGNENTWEIINFDGINEAQTIMNQLESWGGTPDKTLPTNPNEFAARACAMKNKYHVETRTSSGETIYNPVLYEADLKWYLPAQNQAPDMRDNLSGNYWTSTAIIDPGTTAYKYSAGGATSPEDRNSGLHVRAVRNRP